jgi:hypothetical protein
VATVGELAAAATLPAAAQAAQAIAATPTLYLISHLVTLM